MNKKEKEALKKKGYVFIEDNKKFINQIKDNLSKGKFVPKVHLEYLIEYLQLDINELQEQIEMLKMTPNGNYISTVETQIAVLIEENKNLQHQLEEKDKVIDEIKNALTNYKSEWAEDDQVVKDINTFLKILERGKNVNSK